MSSILVTGANGFLGRHVVEHLSKRGHGVRAATRSPARVPPGVDNIVVGDLRQDVDWARAVRSTEVVIHLAARVHVMNDSDPANAALCEAVNVRATRTLLNASINAGVRRVVFLSTVKVLGEGTVDEPWTELHPENPQGSYAISKWTAERLLWEELSGTHTSAVVIRSPLVYGPGVGANFLRLMKLIQRGVPLPLAAVRNRRSMVSVWNLSDFIECAAFSDTAANQTYLISDGTDVSTAELVILLARALERPPRLFRLPLPVLRALATSAGFGKEWRRLSESLVVDISKAKRQLAWRPAVTMEDGIRQTAQWYEAAAR